MKNQSKMDDPPPAESTEDTSLSPDNSVADTNSTRDNDRLSNIDPRSVKGIGVCCRTCNSSIAWDVAFCPKCGETFPFQPRIKSTPNSSVPTAKQAARDYQANLEAAFRAAGHAKQKEKERPTKKKQENKYAGTIVKPHTFSSYGVSSSAAKRAAESATYTPLPSSPNDAAVSFTSSSTGTLTKESRPIKFTNKRRRRKKSSYDISRERLLEKEPSLVKKTSVLNPGASSSSSSSSRPSSSSNGNNTQQQPINYNQHLTDVLVTLCKVEKAEGNLLPAASYERAALSLSRYKKKITNSNDLTSVRGVDTTAQSKIEEILYSEMRRKLGGGKDIMVHASDLIQSMKKNKILSNDTPKIKFAKSQLVAMLEEEQEREREREAFWREKGTQDRSEDEKLELLKIFEKERNDASNNILLLLPHVIGKDKTINMITNMKAGDGDDENADRQQSYQQLQQERREGTPNFTDSGWFGGFDGGSMLPESRSSDDEQESSAILPTIHRNDHQEHQQSQTVSVSSSLSSSTAEKHLPSLLPFARQVLDVEDEHRSRQAMPLYKRNQPKIDSIYLDKKEYHREHDQREYDDDEYGDEEEELTTINTTMNSRQIRYLKKKAIKNIAKNAQKKRQENQIRKRPKQLPVQLENGEVMMINVLDDGWQDNVTKVVPDMKPATILKNMIDLSDGSLVKEDETPPLSTGLFWGPSLSVVNNGYANSNNKYSNTTVNIENERKRSMRAIGGGAFWGSNTSVVKMNDEKGEAEKKEREAREFKVQDVSSDDDDNDEKHDETENNINLRSWQKRRKMKDYQNKKIFKRSKRYTRYICKRMEMKENTKKKAITSIDVSERAPRIGGIGTLQQQQEKKNMSYLSRTPMLTSCCRLPGSVNKGRGEYGIITIISLASSTSSTRGDVVVTAYIPRISKEIALDLSRDEVQFLLGTSNQKKIQNNNLITTRSILASSRKSMKSGRSTGGLSTTRSSLNTERSVTSSSNNNTSRSIQTNIDLEDTNDSNNNNKEKNLNLKSLLTVAEDSPSEFLDASEVQSYGASLKYMRPYWKKHIGPLLSRLEIHEEPGPDFITRIPSLQLDRCILSKTRFVIPIIKLQNYMKASFPSNTHTCTLIIRLERQLNLDREALIHQKEKTDEDQDEDDRKSLELLKKYKNPSFNKKKKVIIQKNESDLALSCTVVFRGTGYSLGGTTCRCVLPFPKMASKLLLNRSATTNLNEVKKSVLSSSTNQSMTGESFEDPMNVVRCGRRDDLIDSVISRLRLAMLSDQKFSKAVSMKNISSGQYELQLLFDWQKPKRDLIVGDPIDDRIVKFLAPHQREMIKLYRLENQNNNDKLLTMIPKTPPPPSQQNTEPSLDEIQKMKDILEMEEKARRDAAAIKIQTIVRRNIAIDSVNEIRSDLRMKLEDEKNNMDSDIEEVNNLYYYRISTSTHLNGKLVQIRIRVTDSKEIASKNDSGDIDLLPYAVHVKIIEPKSRKVARLCVESQKLSELCHTSLDEYMKAMNNTEHPFYNDISGNGISTSTFTMSAMNENKQQLAIMACNVFGSLLLFQSRAKGLLLLKLKNMPKIESKDQIPDINNKNDSAKDTRLSMLSNNDNSLSHSPMLSPLGDENNVSTSGNNSGSPPQPSAPKASNGKPPTLKDSQITFEEDDSEELSLIELKQAAARNWRPDSAVQRPKNIPKLPLKQLKFRKRR